MFHNAVRILYFLVLVLFNIGKVLLKSDSEHWDMVFNEREESQLGWFEKDFLQTFRLLNLIPDWQKSTILLPGVGTSKLVEELIRHGCRLILNDISPEAISKVNSRLLEKKANITWLCQDISQPLPESSPPVDIWIDRAVLHFFTDQNDIKGYFANLKSYLKPGGYAIFAEFSLTGREKCAHLKLHRYSVDEISDRLGESSKLVSSFDFTFTNPRGEPRPYIYALYKRN